ncbi:MAG TPA: glycosyltransferase [Collinsella ihuae]|uniref:Glycosyltransferase n=1 Tax=Collinsella ihumii TaxID=1720204 RepID=A0A921LQU4_9ACTN|nr:glycosyltransferase [Collinsella ihumii]
MSVRSVTHISASIVTFNPDIDRLKENLDAISPQVHAVYLVDNGSKNADEIALLVKGYENAALIKLDENRGLAAAMNVASRQAVRDGSRSMLYLDQDSVSAPGMVRVLARYQGPGIAIVAPQIVDRNKEGASDPAACLDRKTYKVASAARKGIITSGALVDLRAFFLVGGYDERFFIDYVDYDLNKRLLLEGFSLIRTGETYLLHECGKAVPTFLIVPRRGQDGRWCLERFCTFGHEAFRCYYKARNRVLFTKKYRLCGGNKGFEGTRQIAVQIILTLLFESDKRAKLKQFMRGIRDGRATAVDPYIPQCAERVPAFEGAQHG